MVSRETPILKLSAISKSYGDTLALDKVSLEVRAGEVLSLLGPSGSGKSTLLRIVAGLTIPDMGTLLFKGTDITRLAPHVRGFGMMFQQFALFPHRTVAENIAFGLEMQKWSPHDVKKRVADMLTLVGMSGYGSRTIFELSGGEQQRVALARSLAPKPPLLLLDEPLGSLDRRLREQLVEELREILSHISTTAIYVTHDQQEAFAISDRLALMNSGQIVQVGSPLTLYRHPQNRFVAEFFGLQNIVPMQECCPGPRPATLRAVTPLGPLVLKDDGRARGDALILHAEAATPVDGSGGDNVIEGMVVSNSFRGGHYRLVTQHRDVGTLEWNIQDGGFKIEVGEPIWLAIRENGISVLSS